MTYIKFCPREYGHYFREESFEYVSVRIKEGIVRTEKKGDHIKNPRLHVSGLTKLTAVKQFHDL